MYFALYLYGISSSIVYSAIIYIIFFGVSTMIIRTYLFPLAKF